jgi:hypothetical protein
MTLKTPPGDASSASKAARRARKATAKSRPPAPRGAKAGKQPIRPEADPECHPDLIPFQKFIQKCTLDPDAALEPDAIEMIAELKRSKLATYSRLRRHLKRLNVPVLEVDRAVLDKLRSIDGEVDHALRAKADPSYNASDSDEAGDPEPRIVINDTTIEKAATIAADQPRGLLLVRDEISAFLGNMSRYANGGSDRGFWLEAYGGRRYRVDRLSRPSIVVDRLTIAIMGGIQPDKLSSLLLDAEDDGLLARFLPFWPLPAPLQRPTRAPDIEFAEAAFARLYSLAMTVTEPGLPPRPWVIRFDPEASQRLDAFRQWARDRETEESGMMVSFIGKTPGFFVRIALIMAFLDWAGESGRPAPSKINDTHAARAQVLIVEYLLPMARRAYAEAAVPREVRSAQLLARLIIDDGLESFSQREVARREKPGLRTAAEIEVAVDVLVQAGWITVPKKQSGPRGGRPKQEYTVVARVHELAKAHACSRPAANSFVGYVGFVG